MKTRHFFAVDLGATSGRTILGTLSDGKSTQNRTAAGSHRVDRYRYMGGRFCDGRERWCVFA